MNRIAPLGIALLPGCVVYSSDTVVHDPPGTVVVVEANHDPLVLDAAAWVYYDPFYHDDVWVFDAVVDDPDSPYDVIGVWADVYDEWAGGFLVESFELYPTDDPYYWASDWLGGSTFLDPFWPGYTVDLIAYDAYECFGWMTVWAETY